MIHTRVTAEKVIAKYSSTIQFNSSILGSVDNGRQIGHRV